MKQLCVNVFDWCERNHNNIYIYNRMKTTLQTRPTFQIRGYSTDTYMQLIPTLLYARVHARAHTHTHTYLPTIHFLFQ